jgi:hypothetical protein
VHLSCRSLHNNVLDLSLIYYSMLYTKESTVLAFLVNSVPVPHAEFVRDVNRKQWGGCFDPL